MEKYVGTLDKMWSTGIAREHAYRPALAELLEGQLDGITPVNDPAQVECGAPDFVLLKSGTPIGHIEAKDLGANLDALVDSDQIRRYRAGLPNFILTNYVQFIWFVDGEESRRVTIGEKGKPKAPIVRLSERFPELEALLAEFAAMVTPQITTASDLARRLANVATLIRTAVADRLRLKSKSALHEQLEYFRRMLSVNMDVSDFADIYAQTIAYGLFTARCYHDGKEPFTRHKAAYELPRSNPFLRSIYSQLAGPEIEPSLVWAVDHLADLLDRTAIDKVLNQFATKSGRSDPVFYFYEDFLENYDPTLKELRGVYYTPEPVVDYIARSIHELLISVFGLKRGLADRSKVPLVGQAGEKEEVHRVIVLDPAAGTGTFLASVMSLIEEVETTQGRGGAWKVYVREHLLPRVYGLELLMAPYTVCHLKLGLLLAKSGFEFGEGERIGVYLTNSLEDPLALLEASPFLKALREEAAEAGRVKRDVPVMVVLGNPPYSGHSANSGAFLERLLRGFDIASGEEAESYFHIDGVSIGERQPKWLNDDYVKFIRFSQWKIEHNGSGVLGFITNHNYLSAPTFRAMRASLLNTFDDIYILDLHGSAKRKDRAIDGTLDQNVFDIQQGVAMGLFVKRGDEFSDGTKRVHHYSLRGPRSTALDAEPLGKYQWLDAHSVKNTEWRTIEPAAPYYLYVPRDKNIAEEYKRGVCLKDLFCTSGVGIVAGRDHFNFAFTPEELEERIFEFISLSPDEARTRFKLGKDSTAWSVANARADIERHGSVEELIVPALYRPFDRRYTYYTGASNGFLARPTAKVNRHMVLGPNLAICTARSVEVLSGWSHVLTVDSMSQHHAVSTKEVNHLFPLWTYSHVMNTLTRHHNLNLAGIAAFSERLALPFEEGATGRNDAFGERDVFCYALAVLHSAEYRLRYAEPLRDDYARIPLTADAGLFRELAAIGAEILSLHTTYTERDTHSTFPAKGSNEVTRGQFVADDSGCVWINDEQHFTGVDEQMDSFSVGGIRIVSQWLYDRRGRVLSTDDVDLFMSVLGAISRLTEIPTEVDEVIEKHGWPLL